MDKIAANNHFVILRKEIKKAKAMVSGKLIRKIKELKKEIEGVDDEAKVGKIENKIRSIHEEIKLLKKLDSYPIAKLATLKPGKDHWDKLASHSKATPEERLTALVVCKNNIQKQVTKFREDHKDCDEWLEEYIEYREKKNQLVKPRNQFKKATKLSPTEPRKSQDTGRQRVGDKSNSRKHNSADAKRERTRNEPRSVEGLTEHEPVSSPEESLHPSWESKRREKEMLKAALSGKNGQPKRIKFE